MSDVWTVATIFVLFAAIVGVIRKKPEAALGLLIISTALNRYRFDIFSAGIRIEHVALLVAFLFLVVQIVRTRRLPVFRLEDLFLAIFILIALVSSYRNAPVFMESLKYVLLMTACGFIYFVTRTLVTDSKIFRTGLIALLATGVGAALFGILAWLVYPLGINIGVVLYPVELAANRMTGICTYSPFGTLIEGNIFGSFQASTTIMLLSLATLTLNTQRRIYGAVVFTLIGLAISLTRGAWAGFLAGIFTLILFSSARRRALAIMLMSLVILVPMITLAGNIVTNCHLVSSPNGWLYVPTETPESKIQQARVKNKIPRKVSKKPKADLRFTSLNASRVKSGFTMSGRVVVIRSALSHWRQHLWIGNGANTFAQRYITSSATKAWISNFPVMLLHDQGIAGMVILLLALIHVSRDLYRALKSYRNQDLLRHGIIALSIAFVTLMVAYQFTSALWLGYTWIHLGLLRAGSLIALREARLEPTPVL